MRMLCAEAQLPEEISSQVLQTGHCTFSGLPVQGCLCASEKPLNFLEAVRVFQRYFDKVALPGDMYAGDFLLHTDGCGKKAL